MEETNSGPKKETDSRLELSYIWATLADQFCPKCSPIRCDLVAREIFIHWGTLPSWGGTGEVALVVADMHVLRVLCSNKCQVTTEEALFLVVIMNRNLDG